MADNGKEFARHKEIAKGLVVEFYFAHPHYSWDRGAYENTTGLICQYILKSTDFSELTAEMLAETEWELSHRPRKSLGYRTRWNIVNNYLTLTFEVCCTSN